MLFGRSRLHLFVALAAFVACAGESLFDDDEPTPQAQDIPQDLPQDFPQDFPEDAPKKASSQKAPRQKPVNVVGPYSGSEGGGSAGNGEKCYAGGCGMEIGELLNKVLPGAEVTLMKRAESALIDEGVLMESHVKELHPLDFDAMRIPALAKSRLREWLAHQPVGKPGGKASAEGAEAAEGGAASGDPPSEAGAADDEMEGHDEL
ncbi:unnamed protein product [Polarella glacialis]|uniref:Uncharacterized protein n=1 Tax=Polarella glacialis TaxID=89957 RepID=A0A813KR82_POLGL|nr:unnamed protein product [Polarella glacialis]